MKQERLLVGVDVGFRRHHVAIGGPGGIVDEFEITHDSKGFEHFFNQIKMQTHHQKFPTVVVGMEGTNGHARPLDQMVKNQGYTLLNVNNLKFARFKEIFATPAKTDQIDAKQIVTLMMMAPFMQQMKETLQETPKIDEIEMQLKRISRRRRQLVQEKVIVQNRMQADLQSVCPGFLDTVKKVDSLYVLNFLSSRKSIRKLAKLSPAKMQKIPGIGEHFAAKLGSWQKTATFGAEADWVGPMIHMDAKRILELKEQIKTLEEQLQGLIEKSYLASLLMSIPGYGPICAAEICGEIGTLTRFDTEAGLAMYMGMAPIDNSSGDYKGTKTPRHVNKRAKAAMMAALGIHIQNVPQSRLYYQRKRAQGKKHNQALRSLGRHMTRIIWSMAKYNRPYEIRTCPPEEPPNVTAA